MALRKRVKAKKLIGSSDFHRNAGMVRADLAKTGIPVQIYSMNGRVPVWAGYHYLQEVSPKHLYKLETRWRRWRHWFDKLPKNRALDYPAKSGARYGDRLVYHLSGSREMKTLLVPAPKMEVAP